MHPPVFLYRSWNPVSNGFREILLRDVRNSRARTAIMVMQDSRHPAKRLLDFSRQVMILIFVR